MNSYLKNKLRTLSGIQDISTLDFKTKKLNSDMNIKNIDFLNSRGSVRIVNQMVLTPAKQNSMRLNVLALNFEK